MELLANPVWHALTGPQAEIADGGPPAVRFDPGVSVFGALPDEPTDEAWNALGRLVGVGNLVVLMREQLDPPVGWTTAFAGIGVQMAWRGHREPADDRIGFATDGTGAVDIVQLDQPDVPEMVDLVERTEPGPFTARTIELGTYVGVRDPSDGRLVAMAGQRLRPPGHVEISAVCTDPDFRGRGLGRALVAQLMTEIADAGHVPILHASQDNVGAIRLYESMGFDSVRQVRFAALQPPG